MYLRAKGSTLSREESRQFRECCVQLHLTGAPISGRMRPASREGWRPHQPACPGKVVRKETLPDAAERQRSGLALFLPASCLVCRQHVLLGHPAFAGEPGRGADLVDARVDALLWQRGVARGRLRVCAWALPGRFRGYFPGALPGVLPGGASGGTSGGTSGGPAFNGLDAGCCRVCGGVGVREAFASAYVIVKAARAAGKELCDGPAPRV